MTSVHTSIILHPCKNNSQNSQLLQLPCFIKRDPMLALGRRKKRSTHFVQIGFIAR